MGAVIVKGGSVLASAANDTKGGKHAEIRALHPDISFNGATMYITRPSGERTSRPCRACFLTIKLAGIKKIIFTDEEGSLVEKKVDKEMMLAYRDYKLERS